MNLFLFILAASPLMVTLIHAALNRVPAVTRGLPRQFVALLAGAAGAAPMGLLSWVVYLFLADTIQIPSPIIYTATTYIALCYCYFHIFNMSETARRVRILREIDCGKSLSELSGVYQSGRMLENRLERLLATGQIKLSDGRYFIRSRTLLYAAKLLFLWGRILGLKARERL